MTTRIRRKKGKRAMYAAPLTADERDEIREDIAAMLGHQAANLVLLNCIHSPAYGRFLLDTVRCGKIKKGPLPNPT